MSRPEPAPEGLDLSCLRLGISVTDAVYVDDAAVDVQCADGRERDRHPCSMGAQNGTTQKAERIARRPHDVIDLMNLQTQYRPQI